MVSLTSSNHKIDSYSVILLRDIGIDVRTPGYFAFPASYPVLDLTDETSYRKLEEPETRSKKNGSALVIRFTGVKPEEADRISITMSVLLTEVIKTLFPYNWQCISVCPSLHGSVNEAEGDIPLNTLKKAYPWFTNYEGESADIDNAVNQNSKQENQEKSKFNTEIGKDTAEIWILEDSAYDTGVLEALSNDRQNPLSNVFTLLEDYLTWQETVLAKGNIHKDYLQFGAEQIPSYLNLEYVHAIMQKMKVRRSTGVAHQGGEDDVPTDRCCYCNTPLSVKDFVKMKGDDGKVDRAVCLDCAKRCLNKPEEVKPLLDQTKSYLIENFGIDLPKGMKIKLASSSTMVKRHGNPKHKKRRSIIGLACFPSKEVFVENNAPPEHMLHVLAHEITHQWQYDNIECNNSEVMEGHASYVEVQYLEYLKEEELARRWKSGLLAADDEYGRGFRALQTAMETREDNNTFTYVLENYANKKNRKKIEKQGKEQKES